MLFPMKAQEKDIGACPDECHRRRGNENDFCKK